MATPAFTMHPSGHFDLALQSRHFGGWFAYSPDPAVVAMTFPVEGWEASATVLMRQPDPSTIIGEVHGRGVDADRAWTQALATVSLDVDGSGFAAVGERDPVIGHLQQLYGGLRPTLFHSPYEAACNFIIGQRISIAQARSVRTRLAREHGDHVPVDGVDLAAFPRPEVLLNLDTLGSLPAEKVRRLHVVAAAARDGLLDRDRLRAMPIDTALADLVALHGIGTFSAQGILHRGAGVVDDVTDEPLSKQAVQALYGLDHAPTQAELVDRAEAWRPYRMWALVLLHVWLRAEGGGPAPRRPGPAAGPTAAGVSD